MSSLSDQLKGLLREIECPICNEHLHTNIPVCLQGHSICLTCRRKSSNCPTCKSAFGNGRNYVLESLISSIRIPCKFKPDGCKLQRNFAEIAKHVNKCEYKDYPCPLSKSHNCVWLGKCQKFQSHLEEMHKNVQFQYTFDIGTAIFYIFYENYTFKIWRKYAAEAGLVTWVVQFLGKQELAKNYLFRVEFVDHKNNGMELSMTTECIPECNDDQVFENAVISFPVKMLEYFKLEGIYSHKISIQNKKVL